MNIMYIYNIKHNFIFQVDCVRFWHYPSLIYNACLFPETQDNLVGARRF